MLALTTKYAVVPGVISASDQRSSSELRSNTAYTVVYQVAVVLLVAAYDSIEIEDDNQAEAHVLI